MKLSGWIRLFVGAACISTVASSIVLDHRVRPASSVGIEVSHYSLQPMAIQFNAYGGLGDAYNQFNSDTAALSNSVITRLIARGPMWQRLA